MAIIYNQDKQIFSLHTKNTTYQMQVGIYGHLLHLYYGKRTEDCLDYLLTYYDRGFSGNPYEAGDNRAYSLDALPQEYPVYGTGDYRTTAFWVQNPDGSYSVDLRYHSYEIKKGLENLPGLPNVHEEAEEGETLYITLKDEHNGLFVTLIYGVMENQDVITRSAKICNMSRNEISICKVASMAQDFLYGNYELIHFHGKHGMERMYERNSLMHGKMEIGSRRGTSSHQHNPFVILAEENTTEDYGNCYGYSLLYSGNYKIEAELDQFQQTRIVVGLSDEFFQWKLQSGENFFTPQVAMCYSDKGLTDLSQKYHHLIRYNICRGKNKEQQRPVLINNWEATYFDFTGDKIVAIAKQASELGVDMLVLDDGWFGKRDDDRAGLGDWFVNEKKLGGSLDSVVKRVNDLGMKFGLWIEPEMISEDSNLYKEHPDWAFTIPGRNPVRARYQLVLDYSRKEVVDCIFEQISSVIESTNISYIKMDMNRHLSDVYSATAKEQNQGAILHKYVLGVYDFIERLIQKFPDILIEGCSGGGGRFDAGMLYYTPQIWCSDNTDAIERIKIQYGTSFGYPISTVGSHVSAVPNHQTGRTTNIKTRGIVAMAGSFGYELDLNLITDEEKDIVRKQIADFKKYWNVIHNGAYYRLSNPFENQEYAAWQFVNEQEVLLNIVTLSTHCNPATEYVRLKGLDPKAVYCVEETGREYTGAALMYAGLPIPRMEDEYQGLQFYLKKVMK